MGQWANYPHVESSARPLLGIPSGQIPIRYPRLRADGVLAIPASRAGRWHVVRPLGLGLIGLVLAIVLWGIGYRLSLYGLRTFPYARVSVGKLWVGPRQAACVSSRAKRLTQPLPDSRLVGVYSYTSIHRLDALFKSSAASASHVIFRLLLGTLRSPPRRICESS